MHRRQLSARSAAIFSLAISALMHLLVVLMFLYGRDAWGPPDAHGHPERHTFDLIRITVSFINTFLISFILYMLNFRILKLKMGGGAKLTILIVSTLIAVNILSWLSSHLQIMLFDYGPHPQRFIRGSLGRDLFTAMLVVFSSELLYLSHRRNQMAVENEALKAENMSSRYEALKNQVDPHFLFNSLNTLNSIIKSDPKRAQEYVHQLSHVFRYTLQTKDVNTLENELDFTRAYCSLMQIRYGESLQFDFRIDDAYSSYCVVPLSIQTLVENAIKHNVISNRCPLTITIATAADDTLTVSNPRQEKKDTEAGEGIGLANLAERYRIKWQRDISVSNAGGIFSVTIPLMKQ